MNLFSSAGDKLPCGWGWGCGARCPRVEAPSRRLSALSLNSSVQQDFIGRTGVCVFEEVLFIRRSCSPCGNPCTAGLPLDP